MAFPHPLSPPQTDTLLQPLHPLPGGIQNVLEPIFLRHLAAGLRGKLPRCQLAVCQLAGVEEQWRDWTSKGGWGGRI